MTVAWLSWNDVPWLKPSQAGSGILTLCDALLKALPEAHSVPDFLAEQLPSVAAEFSAQWVGLMRRTPVWETVSEWGRSPATELPFPMMAEALDREAAAFETADAGGTFLVVPLQSQAIDGYALVLHGRGLTKSELPGALAVGQALCCCLGVSTARERIARRVERLQVTLDIASSMAGVRESEPLLELIANEATRLLDCDRASIFVWEREHRELVARPALGVEGGTLRVPEKAGLVGEVIRTGESIRIDDAYADPRFNQKVDKKSGYRTRNILCAPLRDESGSVIGAFQVINKQTGDFTQDDETSLEELALPTAIAIRNTSEREQLVRSRDQLAEQVSAGARIIGESPSIEALRSTIERLAETDLPVLILGESGTGKEVVSQSLHYQGARAEQPFVAVNCAALTESLLESELFGHEKGAFTDAQDMRQGKFELAEGGTLFLDEIGDMSLGGQAKLLRVLEQKVVMRVGGSQPIPINVRVIAATNANLAEAVRDKRFRQDLYYRLSVVTLDLPPLRDRAEDILPLAEHFLVGFCAQAGRSLLKISKEARERMRSHGWPGNVRELRNLMERVAFLAAEDEVRVDDLAFILSPGGETTLSSAAGSGLADATKQFQRDYIRQTIDRAGGNMSEAARGMDLHRSNLYRKMRQLDMDEAGEAE